MNSRRKFFRKLAGFAATVAIAPQIAFRQPKALPDLSMAVDGDYECVMALPTREIVLKSVTWVAYIESPHQWYVVTDPSDDK